MFSRLYPVFTALILLLAGSAPLSAQQFHFRNYSVGEGLAQSQVFSLLEDSRGYLWMGTRGGGISRFDGRTFQTYTSRDGLVNNYIFTIYEDAQGHLWIGTNHGVSRYDGNEFETVPLFSDSIQYSVSCVLQDSRGAYWFGTNRGLYRLAGGSIQPFWSGKAPIGPRITSLLEDPLGRICIGHDRGLTIIDGDSVNTYGRTDGLSQQSVECLMVGPDSNLWMGTYGGGINRLQDGKFQQLYPGRTRDSRTVLSLLTDRHGNVWAGTVGEGVFRWSPADSTFTQLTEADGLANNHVRSLLEDAVGNLWIGTSGGGVSQYSGQQFLHYDQFSGLPGKYVYSVYQDSRGHHWMGTSGLGVTRYDGQQFVTFQQDSGFVNLKVKAIFEDCDGLLWFGTEGGGIVRYDGTSFTQYRGSRIGDKGLSDSWVRGIAQDRNDNLWVATAGRGITKMVPLDSNRTQFRFEHFTRRSKGMPKERISSIHVDKWDRVWFGMVSGGIGYLENDSVRAFPAQASLEGQRVRTMVEDAFGHLWVATEERGVYQVSLYADSARVVNLTTEQGLASNNIYLLVEDEEQQLWAGSESGVDRIALDDDRQLLDVTHFGKAEGFVGIETTRGAAWRDWQGHLWFGTINGLTRYRPGSLIKNPEPPQLHLREVSLFYEPLRQTRFAGWVGDWGHLKSGLELPHDQNHLGFDFAGINLKNPDKVRYQWKLEGWEEDWSPVSAKSDVTYSNLPPGRYNLLVKAVNEDGVWTPTPLSVAFTILQPFWQKWWFMAAAMATGALIIFLIVRVRLRQLANERQRLQMEKGLLELEQKALRLQMNPHFIFNALNSIQGQIHKKDEKTARYFLAKFSKLMRAILENSRSAAIPLEQEVQTLENYLSLEQFSRGNTFEFEVDLSPSVDPEAIRIPPMMIQPFIENAIIHGVGHLTEKGRINVHFERQNGHLACTVTDNGIGRDRAAAINSQLDHHHKSTALVVTQERLDRLQNGKQPVHSLEIEDLKNAQGAPAGTRVLLRIPLVDTEA